MSTIEPLVIARPRKTPSHDFSSLTRDELEVENIEVAVSASIGISLYPENGTTAEELIRSADKAMYRVKHEGKTPLALFDQSRVANFLVVTTDWV